MVQPPLKRPPGPAERHPRGRKVFLVAVAVLSLGVAAGSGFAIATIRHVESQITKLEVGQGCADPDCLSAVVPEAQCSKVACNFLVLGSDSRQGFVQNTQVAGERADTIIVV